VNGHGANRPTGAKCHGHCLALQPSFFMLLGRRRRGIDSDQDCPTVTNLFLVACYADYGATIGRYGTPTDPA
jgi:hypothetical protein